MKCVKFTATVSALGASVLFPLAGAGAQSTQLPEGPGKALVMETCTGCHTLELITAKRETPEGWGEIVNRMIANGAAMSEDDYKKVVAYLGTYLGKASATTAGQSSTHLATNTVPATAPTEPATKRTVR